MGETLHIDGTYSKVVNFAMQQNYVPVIRKLTLKNPGEMALEDLTVSVEVTPAFAAAWQEKIAQIPAGETVDLGAVPLLLLPEYLYTLTERVAGALTITVTDGGGEVLGQVRQPMDVLAYDEWSGLLFMPEIIAAFITPNYPKVGQVIRSASALLEE